MSGETGPRWKNGAAVLAGLLGALAAAKLALTLGGWGRQWWHHDLWTLWRDQQVFWSGVYPHASVSAEAGAVRTAYPPMSFPLFAPWLPPGLGWPIGRIWFALCQVAALAALGWFAWRRGRELDVRLGWLLVAALMAMSGVRADLLFGNMGLITTALLLACLAGLERGQVGAASAAWLGAMVKPQIGWLFVLAWWQRERRRAVLVALLLLVASGGAACVWTGVSFARALGAGAGEEVTKWGAWTPLNNLPVWLGAWGLSPQVALGLGAVLALASGAWAVTRPGLRDDWLGQFAVLGLVNRVGVYHNYCDDVLLVFAVVWIGVRAWRGSWFARAVWLALVGATTLPTAALALAPVKCAVLAVWIGSAWWIVQSASAHQRGD